MGLLRRVGALGALLLTLGVAGTSAAQEGDEELAAGLEKSLAIVELYVEDQEYDKNRDYVRAIRRELNELGRYAVLSRGDAREQVREVMTTSPRRLTEEQLEEIEKQMKKGDRLVYVNPQKAIGILDQAKNELKNIMKKIHKNQKIRKDLFRTQMLLARSHFDNGNKDKARSILREVVRVFGDDYEVSEKNYHPNIVALYRETYREMSEKREGVLEVETEPSGAQILLNGKPQSKRSPATFEGLYPGELTVAARKNGQESMVHQVEIDRREPTKLRIDIGYEQAVALGDDEFGFRFSDVQQLQEQVSEHAARMGELLEVDYVLATGLVARNGRTFLDAHLVRVEDATVERRASLYTKRNVVSDNRVRQIARRMSGVEAEAGAFTPWYTNWVGWTGIGVAVGSSAVASYFLADYLSKKDRLDGYGETCPEKVDCESLGSTILTRRRVSQGMAVVGGAALVGSILAFTLMGEDGGASTADASSDFEFRFAGPTRFPGGASGVGARFDF